MPRTSIVIRCYNEEKHIGRLLTGIMQQTVKDVEIIVVDSGSSDATVSIASRFPVKILNIQPQDFSFGYSLNVGCKAANGDYIVVASAHVYPVFTDWIEKLLAPFEDSGVAMVYGKQRGNIKTKFSEHQVFAKWFPEASNPNQKHPFCNNANAAIRKTLWRRISYNENLTGLEDLDWAKRAVYAGYKIAYQADAVVIHVHNETSAGTYNRYRREAIAFKSIFTLEHFNLKDFLVFFSSNVMRDFIHALQECVFTKKWIEILSFRFMQFWGTYRGFAQSSPVTRQLKKTFYYSNQVRPKPMKQPNNGNGKKVDYSSGSRLYREDN